MSDYISKSALIEKTMEWVKELKNSPDKGERIYANDVELFLDEHIRTEPTISETKIVRKAFERVVERLRKAEKELVGNSDSVDCTMGILNASMRAIEIVKEEGGME